MCSINLNTTRSQRRQCSVGVIAAATSATILTAASAKANIEIAVVQPDVACDCDAKVNGERRLPGGTLETEHDDLASLSEYLFLSV